MSVKAMEWAFRQGVSGTDKVLLLALADHVGPDGTCYPGQKRLAEKCSVTDRAIRDSVKRLEARGLVRREKRNRKDGSRASDLYLLTFQPEDSSPPTGSSTSSYRKPTSGHEPSVEPSDTYTGAFKEWLEHYRLTTDRKHMRGSRPAREAFNARMKDGYTLDDLKLATEGCHADDYCREHGHDVPTTILRPSKVDRYIELGRKAGKPADDFDVTSDW